MKCRKCHFENREKAKFCSNCGNKLEPLCQKCGNSNPSRSKFCDHCGHKLISLSPPVNGELSFDEKLDKIQRYLPKGLIEKVLSQRDKIEGEHRQVTVMFCDMESFTPLVEKLGPEQAYIIMDQVYEILILKVHKYEGTVNEMTGDGIMALYGAPVALEDAPQRAVRSAMAIHREITRFMDKLRQENNDVSSIKMRVGIHTGQVVVGTLGNDLRVEFKVVGDTVNLASRMEGIAQPGTTYVTEETFKLAEGFFRFESLGEKKVKGRQKSVRAYRVIAPNTLRTRFDVSAEKGLTPFIARERELELLLDGFERIKTGRGHAFSIIAEAGMGKSRLLYEFRKTIANEDITFLEGKCLSYNRGLAYHPILEILKANFNIHGNDQDVEVRDKIIRGLTLLGPDEATALPYLLELLSVKESGVDKLFLSPEARKAKTLDSINRIIVKASRIRPLVVAFEDLHWLDESSEQVLKGLLNSIPEQRILLIFTYRPEYSHTWINNNHHSRLTLNRFSNRENQIMTSHLLGTNVLDKALEELILEKTEGVPFFIEEFIMSFTDLKVIERKGGQCRLVKNSQHIAVPSTIQDVIMARVDTLPQGAKEVLQIGSVIEREFRLELLMRGMGITEGELLSHLLLLKETELVYEQRSQSKTTYVFKHALTRDVIYHSILARNRKKLHRKIGNAIETLYKETIIDYYGVLAEHFTIGGNYVKGAEYSRLASARSERAGAINDAIVYTMKRVSSLEKLSQTDEVQEQIIDARTALGGYLLRKLLYKEAKEAIDPIIGIAIQRNYKTRLPEILTISGTYQMNIEEDSSKAFEYLEKAFNISRELNDNASLSFSSWRLGLTRALNCEFEKATHYFNNALAIMRTMNNPWGESATNSYLTIWGHGFLGKIDKARQTSNEAIRIAEKNGDIYSKSMAYTSRGFYLYLVGRLDEAAKHLLKAITFCEKIDYVIFNAMARIFLGELCYDIGDYQNAKIHHARALWFLEKYSIYDSWISFHKLGVAKSQAAMDKNSVDLNLLISFANGNRVKLFESWKQRYLGEIMLNSDTLNLSEAESWFKKAVASDKRNSMLWYLAKDYMLLADLFLNKGDKPQARNNFGEAVKYFKECRADGWVKKIEKKLGAIS